MSVFLVKYGEQSTIVFPLIKRAVVDLAVTADYTPATADGAISKDAGNFADLTNTIAIVGGSPTRGSAMWKLVLTGTECTCAEANVQIVDAATKAIEDQGIKILTWGHPSAKYPFDLYPQQSPYPAEVTATSFNSDATSHAVGMPGNVQLGDLLICFFCNDGSATVTTPTGWTQLHTTVDGTNAVRLSSYAKKADGTEVGTTVDFVTSATERAVAQVYRFQKGTWYGDNSSSFANSIAIGTAASGSSTTPDPPACLPGWKKLASLFIAVMGKDDGTAVDTATPTNYYDRTMTQANDVAGVAITSLIRSQSSASEDPGTFTIATEQWVTQTVAIRCAQPVALVDGANIVRILDTAISTPATAGVLDVNVKNMNNVSASSITAVNANQGTTQPVNFSGTGATAYVKGDVTQWLTVAPLALSSQQVQAIVPDTQKVDVNTIKTNPVVNAGTITFPSNATLASTTNITAGTITTVTTVTNQLTAAQIATGVWQDTTAGDFTVASSIGKSLYTGNVVPGGSGGLMISGTNAGTTTLGALTVTGATTFTGAVTGTSGSNDLRINGLVPGATGGLFIAGTNAATTITTGLTTTFTGNLTGSVGSVTGAVGSVTGAVGSVTGNVGGNVVGSVASVTAAVTLSAADKQSQSTGTATAGGATSITLQTALGADSLPVGSFIKITSGTGTGQTRVITAYVDSTKVVTVGRAWVTNPDNTSVYAIVYGDNPKVDSSLKISGVVLTDTITTYTGNTVQTGDSFARIGATGSGLTSLAPSSTALSTAQWTNTLATNLGTTNTTVASNLDAAVTSRMASYTQPTGFLAATFPATIASTTNITAGTITTVTNLTNAPTSGDFTATMKTSIGTAVAASAVASVTGNVGGNVTGSVGSVTGNVGGNVTGTIGGLTAAALKDFFDTDTTTTYASAVAGSVVKEIVDNAGGGTPPTAAEIADAVWDEVQSGHTTNGTFGKYLDASVSGVSTGGVSAGDIATAVWADLLAGSDFSTVGSIGKLIKDNVNTTISSRSSHSASDVWAVATRVLTAGTNIALAKGVGVTGFNDIAATDVWAAGTRTLSAGTNIVLAKGTGITGFNDISTAQVNTEVNTALADVGLTTTITGRIDAAITTRMATFTLPTNFADLAITASTGRVTAGTVSDKTGYSITGTTTTFDALQTALSSAHGAGSWSTATGFSTHTALDVWGVTTRTLSAGTNIVLAKGTGITGFNDIAAGDVWANATRTLTSLTGLTVDTVTTVTTLTNLPAITTNWLTAAGVSAGAANKMADHHRRRTQANVEASSDGDALSLLSLYGFIQMAQESSTAVSAGFLTVYQTDGTTVLGTRSLTADDTADPITGIS